MTIRCTRPLTVDAIIIYDDRLVLIRRKNEPFRGMQALPGGFVEKDETVEQAVARETKEETGLDTVIVRLIGVYSDPGRDPRGPTVSICYRLAVTGGSPWLRPMPLPSSWYRPARCRRWPSTMTG